MYKLMSIGVPLSLPVTETSKLVIDDHFGWIQSRREMEQFQYPEQNNHQSSPAPMMVYVDDQTALADLMGATASHYARYVG